MKLKFRFFLTGLTIGIVATVVALGVTQQPAQAVVGTLDISGSSQTLTGDVTAARIVDSANSAYFIDPAASGTSMSLAGAASISGNLTLPNASGIRPAFGPTTLSYKSGLDAWTTGLVIQDGTGNVGIGTTGPGAKLEVAGNINSSTGAIMTAGVTRINNSGVGTLAAGTTVGGSTVTGASDACRGYSAQVQDSANSATTSTTPQTKLTITVNPSLSCRYLLTAAANRGRQNYNGYIALFVDDVQVSLSRSQDESNGNNGLGSTDSFVAAGTITSGTHTFKLKYWHQNGAGTWNIYNSEMAAMLY